MANEGIEVIQANNRRVAAAKKAAALTARNLHAAKLAVEVAQKEHDEATKELKDAEKSQKAAQEKWEVVDLVEDDEKLPNTKSIEGRKKRAGVLSVSQAIVSKKVRSDSEFAEEITVEGCGVAEANGIYKRNGYCDEVPKYSKRGISFYEGNPVHFMLF